MLVNPHTCVPPRPGGAGYAPVERKALVEQYEDGTDGRRALAYVVCALVDVAKLSRRGNLDAYGDDDDAGWADAVRVRGRDSTGGASRHWDVSA